MRETGKNQELDNLIVDELRTAFGYGKDSLITEFDEAARQMDDSDRIPPEGEFEKILAKVDLLNAEEKKSSKKVIRLRRVGKIGLLVAILGCVLLGTGIGASGKRAYEYSIGTSNQGSVWNNTGNLETTYKVDEAYQKIYDKLGIDVLKLLYIPQEMQLSDLSFGDGYARMEFSCDEKYVYFIQSQDPVDNAGSTSTDCEDGNINSVYNKVLKKDLQIKKNIIHKNKVEYSCEFTIDKTYYYIAGVIQKNEFEEILSKIYR